MGLRCEGAMKKIGFDEKIFLEEELTSIVKWWHNE
jgi:hypothetical protein